MAGVWHGRQAAGTKIPGCTGLVLFDNDAAKESPMPTWDPKQYLQFGSERLRPAVDLLARVSLDSPRSVYDLGCGPGTATALLAARWPKSQVTGVDSSPAMLEKARALYPEIAWREADLDAWTPDEPADVIFSNAALHWVDRHEVLFPRLASYLSPFSPCRSFNFTARHTSVDETIQNSPGARGATLPSPWR
jgi:trans-aconitate methyltransferase